MHEVAFEVFGVRVAFTTNDPELLDQFQELIPPNATPCEASAAEQRFELISRNGDGYDLRLNEDWQLDYKDVQLAWALLDMHMSGYIAVHATNRIFVHAGVVAYRDRLIMAPGMSFSGKSTLVAALVRAGAAYYSDDYALLDEAGRVHPYPKPLSLRGENLIPSTHSPQSLGSVVGLEPRLPSLIVITNYRRGAEWDPRRLSAGAASLAVLANTVPVRERPAESLEAVSRAVEKAIVLEGDRDEADDVVPRLFAALDGD